MVCLGPNTPVLASPEEIGVEQPTEPLTPGDTPVWDDDAVTTCSQDSTDPPNTALLEPTVAAIPSVTLLDTTSLFNSPVPESEEPLSLLPEALSAAASPDPSESPQPSTSHPENIIWVPWSTLMFDSSD